MADVEFVPGQRWVSNTESELGLGIVVENEHRRVTVSFPAAGERRVYAIDNAPVTRVAYDVGEMIRNDEGDALKIGERIDATLGENELGLLMISERHQVQFAQDIEVFYVAPPALAEFKSWLQDWMAAQQKAAREASAPQTETGEEEGPAPGSPGR